MTSWEMGVQESELRLRENELTSTTVINIKNGSKVLVGMDTDGKVVIRSFNGAMSYRATFLEEEAYQLATAIDKVLYNRE